MSLAGLRYVLTKMFGYLYAAAPTLLHLLVMPVLQINTAST